MTGYHVYRDGNAVATHRDGDLLLGHVLIPALTATTVERSTRRATSRTRATTATVTVLARTREADRAGNLTAT